MEALVASVFVFFEVWFPRGNVNSKNRRTRFHGNFLSIPWCVC